MSPIGRSFLLVLDYTRVKLQRFDRECIKMFDTPYTQTEAMINNAAAYWQRYLTTMRRKNQIF